jgi:hypothetical protein
MALHGPTWIHRRRRVPVTRDDCKKYAIAPREVGPSLNRHAGEVAIEEDWLELPIGDGWVAAFLLAHAADEAAHHATVLELRIFPDETNRRPGEWSGSFRGSKATRAARGFSFERVRRQVTERALNAAMEAIRLNVKRQGAIGALGPVGDRRHGTGREGAGAGRKGRSDGFWEQFSKAYHRAENDPRRERGESTYSTHKRLAQQYGKRETTIAKWIQRARAKGFITKTQPGRRGGMARAAVSISPKK